MKEKMKHRDARKLIKKNEFQEVLVGAGAFYRKNSENILIGAIIAVIVIAGIPIYMNYKKGKEEQAEKVLSQANFYINRPVSADKDAAMRGLFTSEEEKYDKATTSYMEVLQGFKGTKAVPHAYIGLADAYYSWGRYREASDYYQVFIDRYSGHELYTAALSGKAYAEYQLGNYQEAAEVWEKAVESGDAGYQYYDMKLNLAGCYLKLGKKDEAKKIYEEIIKDKEGSYWSGFAADKMETAGL